jgi:aldehyde dehydrogenase (NAD+)
MKEKIKNILENQREFFNAQHTLDVEFRIQQLKTLKKAVLEYEDRILAALKTDLRKPQMESFIMEVFYVIHEIDYVLANLRKWAKPQKTKTNRLNFPAKSLIYHDPLGISLIISPWNFPFQLLFAPLVYSMASGNCMILKPSEISSATSKIINELICEYFDESYIAVFEGDAKVSQSLLEEKFDHIFYTGSTHVGRIVMEAAAKHLTPVVLELGGKSPCIVHGDANLEVAARRIIWGKLVNSGQTCVAPDYIYVHRDVREKLVAVLTDTIRQFYGDNPQKSDDFCRIINNNHFKRLLNLMEGDITSFGEPDEDDLYIPPTIIKNADWSYKTMQEEIFGPIMPIIEYSDISDAIKKINQKPKPLSLYLFSDDKNIQHQVLTETRSGGVCINDIMKQITSEYLPFGGVGDSGMGQYHGKSGFETFTHSKSVIIRSFRFDLKMLYPPYKLGLNKMKKIMHWI